MRKSHCVFSPSAKVAKLLCVSPPILDGFNPMSITIDPVAETVNVVLSGVDLGTWTARVAPGFIAIEAQGWADDLVVRTVP